MSFTGMDTAAVDAVARQLNEAANALERIEDTTRTALYSAPWHGCDAERFRDAWQAQHGPALRMTGESLRTTARQLYREVEQQEQASADVSMRTMLGAAGLGVARMTADPAAQMSAAVDPGPGHPAPTTPQPVETGAKAPGASGGVSFVLGPPTKPPIPHDPDFPGEPDDSPGIRDRLNLAKWKAALAAAEAGMKPGLDDATPLYRHYLGGSGTPVEIDLEEGYAEDKQIRRAIDRQVAVTREWADAAARDGSATQFSITGDRVQAKRLVEGYPTSNPNWDRTLGGYSLWSSADVSVVGDRVKMTVLVNAEDRYNFNAGQSDNETGIPDDENARFAQLSWAEGFDVHGAVTRVVEWQLGNPGGHPSNGDPGEPNRNPGTEDREDERGSGDPDRTSRLDTDPGTGDRRGGRR